jgi:hypothetical protein
MAGVSNAIRPARYQQPSDVARIGTHADTLVALRHFRAGLSNQVLGKSFRGYFNAVITLAAQPIGTPEPMIAPPSSCRLYPPEISVSGTHNGVFIRHFRESGCGGADTHFMSVRLSNMPGEDTYIRFEVLHESSRSVQLALTPHSHLLNPMER